jgi:hypothetical protein
VRLLADHCDLYNAALAERREAWRMRRVSISYNMQSAQLKEIRQADPGGQGRHSFTAQQQTLRRLNTVVAAFFDRARTAERAGKRKKPGHPGSSRTSGSARSCLSPGTARSGSHPAPTLGHTLPSRRSARSRCASTGPQTRPGASRHVPCQPGPCQGRAEQVDPRRGLGSVHQDPHRQSGGSWPASGAGEPGRDEHRLPPLRAKMRAPAAEDRDMSRAWRGRRRRERGTKYCVQGRAGLWSGSYGSLRTCCRRAAEQSQQKVNPAAAG